MTREQAEAALKTTAPGRLWLAQRRRASAEQETAVAEWREKARTLETICEDNDADREKLRQQITHLTSSNKMEHRLKIIKDLQQAEAALDAADALADEVADGSVFSSDEALTAYRAKRKKVSRTRRRR